MDNCATGKLPVEVDMDWIPQTTEPVIESPPPIPPKMNEVASFDAPQNGPVGLNQSADIIVPTKQDNDSAPVLPPKPKYVIYWCPQWEWVIVSLMYKQSKLFVALLQCLTTCGFSHFCTS